MCLEEIQDIELLWQAQQPSIFQAAPAKEDEASLHKHTYRTEEATLRGTITLVGAGLGCPELLTFAAIQALRRAEVVLADELVSREILELATGKVITSGKRQNGQDRGRLQTCGRLPSNICSLSRPYLYRSAFPQSARPPRC